jgi:small subunit ribosomal protein S9
MNAIGRRKSSIARVRLTPGNGKIIINDRDGSEYLQFNPKMIYSIQSPLLLLNLEGKYDTIVIASGGGLNGQAEAIKLGVARALCSLDLANRPALKAEGYLTRNAACVERKKYGLKKARKASQYSKR